MAFRACDTELAGGFGLGRFNLAGRRSQVTEGSILSYLYDLDVFEW